MTHPANRKSFKKLQVQGGERGCNRVEPLPLCGEGTAFGNTANPNSVLNPSESGVPSIAHQLCFLSLHKPANPDEPASSRVVYDRWEKPKTWIR